MSEHADAKAAAKNSDIGKSINCFTFILLNVYITSPKASGRETKIQDEILLKPAFQQQNSCLTSITFHPLRDGVGGGYFVFYQHFIPTG
jgi:hypothetical protein